ncbi:MAG: DUF5672 family protein [Thermomonas sp.]|uniref:DUF5672 family protein n=1 Tax=Thermomonas sp. TaxID=1971895 RepID=UPI0039E62E00
MTASAPTAIVAIPIHTTCLSADGRMALMRAVRVLGRHPMAILCPEGLDLAPLQPLFGAIQPRVERFDPAFFDGIAGYNRLMLSEVLYERFIHYDYLLVCQTDAYVFSDQLQAWCARGYDWIGAPWIGSPRNVWSRAQLRIRNLFRRRKKYDDYLFKVGNGGFSLRRVATFLRIVREQRDDIAHRLAHPDDRDLHVEDRYFSQIAPALYPDMRIPSYEEAVAFCMDRRPHLAMAMNGGRLPFACHGFDKRNVRAFWEPILQRSQQEPAAA